MSTSLPEAIARREEFLVGYQNRAYAERYRARLATRRGRRSSACVPEASALQDAVARNYFSVLAYKDEYEVARLHTETGFLESVKRNFGEGARMSFHFSPPLFARHRPRDGAAEEVRARAVGAAVAARAREAALAARHEARSVRL